MIGWDEWLYTIFVVGVMFGGMRFLYGYWPWEQSPAPKTQALSIIVRSVNDKPLSVMLKAAESPESVDHANSSP